MNPIMLIGLFVGGAVLFSMLKTAKTVVNLQYAITRFGIYRITSSGITLRVRVRFSNGEASPLHVNLFDIQAYINPTYTVNPDGKPNISSKGSLLASMSDANGFTVAANNFTERDFFVDVRWADVGKYFINNITDIISIVRDSTSIWNFAQRMAGTPVLIYGTVKVENINIPLTTIVQLQNDIQQ